MNRIDQLISEVQAARSQAIQKFADEVNMPLSAFDRHFRVVLEMQAGDTPSIAFRVEPRDWPPTAEPPPVAPESRP